MRSDDLREELLQAKKAHQMALRDNAQFRTRLRIAERECRRRETEIERLLAATAGANQQQSRPAGLELATLRRKVLLYERMLHEKSAENEKLLADTRVAQAAETRKLVAKLESECQRLRTHLAQSVPESEFLREKEQYIAIISRLVEENMHLRTIIGEFEQRRKEHERLLAEMGGGEGLIRQFRNTTITSRKQANFYKKALGNLLKTNGRMRNRAESMAVPVRRRKEVGEEGDQASWRRKKAFSVEKLLEMKEQEWRELEEEVKANNQNSGVRREKEQESARKTLAMYPQEESPEEEETGSRSSSAPPHSSPRQEPSNQHLPQSSSSSRAAASSTSRKSDSSETAQREEEVTEEEEATNDEDVALMQESHLNALHRLLHSHILRHQMLRVRRDKDSPKRAAALSFF